ncbi:MAG: hypothetical protein KGJ44_07750 [Betaproteobacteria bacterium]|nr:hypothetical protein [Betaproteobacteria bacterium]
MLPPNSQEPRDGDFAGYVDELLRQQALRLQRSGAAPRAVQAAHSPPARAGAPAAARVPAAPAPAPPAAGSSPGQSLAWSGEQIKVLLRALLLSVVAAFALVNGIDQLQGGIDPDHLAPAVVLLVVAAVSGLRAWQGWRTLRGTPDA